MSDIDAREITFGPP